MKLRVRISTGEDSERILMKMAAFSVVGHVIGLVVFSVLPRFVEPPRPARSIIGELVPASALLPPTPLSPSHSAGPTPSERAAAARKASEEAVKPKPPTPPRKKEPSPEPPPEPERTTPPTEPVEAAEPTPVEPEASGGPIDPTEAVSEVTGEEPAPVSPGGISFGGAENPEGIPSIGSSVFPYDYYRSSLVSILQSHWRRPVAAEGLPEALQCRIQFTIIKSGIIQSPTIVSPSGNRALDQSALRAVYDSSPLPPLPFQYGHGSVSAEVLFELTPD